MKKIKLKGLLRRQLSLGTSRYETSIKSTKIFQEFCKNSQRLDDAQIESSRRVIFAEIINNFMQITTNLKPEKAKKKKNFALIERYVGYCATYGILVLDDSLLSLKMFKSIQEIYQMLGNFLPLSSSFITFFSELVQKAKSDPNLVSSVFPMLEILFKSHDFFTEFKKTDGFTLIFVSFFLSAQVKVSGLMLDLLFRVPPVEFYDGAPDSETLNICTQSLKTNDSPWIALFIAEYLASWSDKSTFAAFRDEGHFLNLNAFMLKNCDNNQIVLCYTQMLLKSRLHDVVLFSLYELYIKDECSIDLKTAVLLMLKQYANQILLEKLNNTVPVLEWMLPPSRFSLKAYEVVTALVQDSVSMGVLDAESCIDPFFAIITPACEDANKPVEFLFGVLEVFIAEHRLTTMSLVKHGFVDLFVSGTTDRGFHEYLKIPFVRKVMQSIYSMDGISSNLQHSIVQRVISVYTEDFHDFLTDMLGQHMPDLVFHTLIQLLTKDENLVSVILECISYQPSSFDLFLKSSGFEVLDSLIEKDNAKLALRLLASVVAHGPREEAETWILSHDMDSRLFWGNDDLLSEASRNIGALIRWNQSEDKSLTVLENAAKFGIPLCKKIGMRIRDIPGICEIVNVNCPRTIVKDCLDDVDHLHLCVNREYFPQRSVIELRPDGGPAYLELTSQEPVTSLKFSLFQKRGMAGTILAIGAIVFAISDGGIEVQVEGEVGRTEICQGWNECVVSFQNGLLSFGMTGRHPVEMRCRPGDSMSVVFGNKKRSPSTSLILDSSILINNRQEYKWEQGGNVHTVVFRGFATFFQSIPAVESVFAILESEKEIDRFKSVFAALINLHIVNKYPNIPFWKRILMAVKKMAHVVAPALLWFLHEIPLSRYTSEDLQAFFSVLLEDVELYFSFPPDLLCHLIDQIADVIEPPLISPNIVLHILQTVKGGVSTDVGISLVKVIRKLTTNVHDEQLVQTLVNEVIAMNTNDDLENELWAIAMDAVKRIHGLSLDDLTWISLLCTGNRKVEWLKILSDVSADDPEFVRDTPELKFTFSQCSTSEEVWRVALATWSGVPSGSSTIDQPVIRRSLFTGVVLEMLVGLMRHNAKVALTGAIPDKLELQRALLTRLCQLPPESLASLARPEFAEYLHHIINFGIVPDSMAGYGSDDSRVEHTWKSQLATVRLTDVEMQSICGSCGLEIENEMKVIEYESFPFDSSDCTWFNGLGVDEVIAFVGRVIVSADVCDFEKVFPEMARGHNLMYTCYRKAVTSKLALFVAKELSRGGYEVKQPMRILKQCAMESIFANNYFDLLALVLAYMNSNFSETLIEDFRTIIVLTFHFIDPENWNDIFQVIWYFKDIVFQRSVLFDIDFCRIFLYLFDRIEHKTDIIRKCQTSFYGNAKAEFVGRAQIEEGRLKWNHLLDQVSQNVALKSRDRHARSIIQMTIDNIRAFSKVLLKTKIRKAINSRHCSNIQAKHMNQWLRVYEDFYFKSKQVSRSNRLCYKDAKSLHICPLSMPLKSPRVLSWSPFEIKNPELEQAITADYFQLPSAKVTSKIVQVQNNGLLQASPEWLYFHTDDGESPLSYSWLLATDSLVDDFFHTFGTFEMILPALLGNFVHPIPSVLFVSKEKIALLVLSEYNNGSLKLIVNPPHPVTFLPLSESVALNEWQEASLFCGHIVLSFNTSRLLTRRRHYYIHRLRGLMLSFLFDPTLYIIFEDEAKCDEVDMFLGSVNLEVTAQLSPYRHLFMYEDKKAAFKKWARRELSNYDYLLLLNSFGGRSFTDNSQFPVFPWVKDPNLGNRDMSLPMGQLDKDRAEHFEAMFEEVKYFYGCHYLTPGGVFWYLVRLSPFTYYCFDLNGGWDNEQRMFNSIESAWSFASSKNQTDVKEQVSFLFDMPEMYMNVNNLRLQDVKLPSWTDGSPYCYTAMMRKALEETESLQNWIDLIFGCKQKGSEAVKAKNLFLPTCYHDSSPETLGLDEAAFESQVTDFGQCPLQLFKSHHRVRWQRSKESDVRMLDKYLKVQSASVKNPLSLDFGRIGKGAVLLPVRACLLPPNYDYFILADAAQISIGETDSGRVIFTKRSLPCNPSQVTATGTSHDGMIFSCCFENGKIDVFRIIWAGEQPVDISLVHEFSTYEESVCMALAVCNDDFLLGAAFGRRVIVFNYATHLVHRIIELEEDPIGLMYDNFDGMLIVVCKRRLLEYSINGSKLHDMHVKGDITCFCLVGYDYSFDSRVVVTGDTSGALSFYIVIESFEMRQLLCEQLSDSVSSMFFDSSKEMLWVASRNSSFLIDIGGIKQRGLIQCCEFCGRPIKRTCPNCGAAVCSSCATASGLCGKCHQLELLANST